MIVGGVNRLLLEPYTGSTTPVANVSGGFATIKQRSSLVGLKLISDAIVLHGQDQQSIPAGSICYFEENTLAVEKWATNKLANDEISKSEFVVGNYNKVVAVKVNS